MDRRFDVAVVGGGIIGCAAAAYLAEAGQSVVLIEREEVAAGASGRNSGVLQRPFDPALSELHRHSLTLYRELAEIEPTFELPHGPAGLLLVGPEGDALAALAAELAGGWPDLDAALLPAAEAARLEPELGRGIGAIRLETGYPVVPAAATLAFWRWAERQGAALRLVEVATVWRDGLEVRGVVVDGGARISAGKVLVAAGPRSPRLVPDWHDRPPIRSTYGVVVATSLARPVHHVLEEVGIDPGSDRQPLSFSLVTAGGISSVGSTFLTTEPDPASMARQIIARGTRFVPALDRSRVGGVRVCARPVSYDGRPLIGPVGAGELYACAGHGPWGMSTGPASARLIVEVMLARDAQIPPALATERYSTVNAG